jgi:hypothetical protein
MNDTQSDSKASFLQTVKAVAWSFLGVRNSAGHRDDVTRGSLLHVVVAGLLGAALFVIVLVLLVNWVLSSGIAK